MTIIIHTDGKTDLRVPGLSQAAVNRVVTEISDILDSGATVDSVKITVQED